MAVELPMYDGCALDPSQLQAQLERYRSLARHVIEVRRADGELSAEFGADVPERLLAEALEVERGCCSFLDIAYERKRRRLTIATEDRAHEGVLAAIGDTLADAGGTGN
jgi:hypothetical protein